MKKVLALLAALVLFIILFSSVFGVDSEDPCEPGTAAPVAVEGGGVFPTVADAPVSSNYGPRVGGMHRGIDIAAPHGSPVYAFWPGTVVAAQDSGVQGFGGWVVLDHQVDGKRMSTVYGHMEPGQVHVSVGQTVAAGEHIADVGSAGESSGPHLHFEVLEGSRMDASPKWVDPAPFIKKAGEGSSSASSPSGATGDSDTKTVEDLRASQIISIGKARGEDDFHIIAAIDAAFVESQLKNLASQAVPESKTYPNDGVAPGDYDSVGLFQQRASLWMPPGGMKELMDPRQQVNWFYDQAKHATGSTPGELAANTERPAAQFRFRYPAAEKQAEEIFTRLEGVSPSDVASADRGHCVPGSSDPVAPGSGLDDSGVPARILAAARSQFGLPYVWGGGNTDGPTGSPDPGFDCSGLVLYAVYQATGGGIALPHFTGAQQDDSRLEKVAWEDRRPGDLLYFPGHTSIYSGEKDGVPMQYEAQTFGVPIGEYPVRLGEGVEVRRVPSGVSGPTSSPDKDLQTGDRR